MTKWGAIAVAMSLVIASDVRGVSEVGSLRDPLPSRIADMARTTSEGLVSVRLSYHEITTAGGSTSESQEDTAINGDDRYTRRRESDRIDEELFYEGRLYLRRPPDLRWTPANTRGWSSGGTDSQFIRAAIGPARTARNEVLPLVDLFLQTGNQERLPNAIINGAEVFHLKGTFYTQITGPGLTTPSGDPRESQGRLGDRLAPKFSNQWDLLQHVELWIGVTDQFLRQVKVNGLMTDRGTIVATFERQWTISDHNEPLQLVDTPP